MKIEDVRKVVIVGGGTMGSQISLDCARAGFSTVVHDLSEEVLEGIEERWKYLAFEWLGKGVCSKDDYDAALKNLIRTTDPEEAARDADLLIEAVFEELELKQKIFVQFEKLCPEKTVLASNTSQLLPSQIEQNMSQKDRFCVFHFNWPGTVIDIQRGTKTSEPVVALLKDFSRKIGYLPIVTQKEIAGSIQGAMYSQWLMTALNLASGGFGTIEDIDRAWMRCWGGIMGPLASLDLVGIDLVYQIGMNMKEAGVPGLEPLIDFLQPYIDRGHLGAKTGQGFYTYPNPVWAQPDFLEGEAG